MDDVYYPPNVKAVEPDTTSSALVKNLKVLAEQLQSTENVTAAGTDHVKYESLAAHLLQTKFIRHSSKEVRILIACCLADILRICSPNNPLHSHAQLKEVLSFFIRVLRGLEDTNSGNYHRFFYVLECLASSQSFLLIAQLQSSEAAITLTGKLFNMFFHVVNEEHVGKVRSVMLEIMASLMNETTCMDNEILELIYQHILPPFKHQMPTAYCLASDLLKLTADSIESHVLSFFHEVLLRLDSKEEDTAASVAKSLKQQQQRSSTNAHNSSNNTVKEKGNSLTVQRIYELLYEVYITAPTTLFSVLPLLEIKLKSVAVNERLLAVDCIGNMLGHESSQLYVNNQSLWNSFISRSRDIKSNVRLSVLKKLSLIMQNHYEEVGTEISEALAKLSRDPEGDVRIETIKVVTDIALLNFHHVNGDMLQAVMDRTRDTMWPVRKVALTSISTWYHQLCHNSSHVEKQQYALWSQSSPNVKLSGVADKLLYNYLSSSIEERHLVENLFFEKLLTEYSTTDEDEERAKQDDEEAQENESCCGISNKRLLTIFCEMSDNSVAIVRQMFRQGLIAKYHYDHRSLEDLVKKVAKLMSRSDSDSLNNDFYYYDSDTSSNNQQMASLISTGKVKQRAILLIEMLAAHNKELFTGFKSISPLVRIIEERFRNNNNSDICTSLSHDVYLTLLKALILACNHLKNVVVLFDGAEVTEVSAAFSSRSSSEREEEKRQFENVKNVLLQCSNEIISTSNSAKLCKCAVMLIDAVLLPPPPLNATAAAHNHSDAAASTEANSSLVVKTYSEEKIQIFDKLFTKLTQDLCLASELLLGNLGALCQLAYYAPAHLQESFRTFIKHFVVRELLSFDTTSWAEDVDKEDEERVSNSCTVSSSHQQQQHRHRVLADGEVDCHQVIEAKAYGLKLINRWLLGFDGAANPKIVQSSFTMLASIIENEGNLLPPSAQSDNDESEENGSNHLGVNSSVSTSGLCQKELSLMRLTAGKMILKLNTVDQYSNEMTEKQFQMVASLILDPNANVRSKFAAKLDKLFSTVRLPLRFLAIFAFCGREPDVELKEKFKGYLRKNVTKRVLILKNSLKNNNDASLKKPNGALIDVIVVKLAIFSKLDSVMFFVIHLLAHFHEFDSIKNVEVLKAIKDCLWFFMQVLIQDNENFSYSCHKFLLDALKQCHVNSDHSTPASPEKSTVGRKGRQKKDTSDEDVSSDAKLYAVCDLAMTLLNARVKHFDVIPNAQLHLAIPSKLYKTSWSNGNDKAEQPSKLNTKIYIPQSLTEKPKTISTENEQFSKKKKKVQHDKKSEDSVRDMTEDTATLKTKKKSSEEKNVEKLTKNQSKISDHVMTSIIPPKRMAKASVNYNEATESSSSDTENESTVTKSETSHVSSAKKRLMYSSNRKRKSSPSPIDFNNIKEDDDNHLSMVVKKCDVTDSLISPLSSPANHAKRSPSKNRRWEETGATIQDNKKIVSLFSSEDSTSSSILDGSVEKKRKTAGSSSKLKDVVSGQEIISKSSTENRNDRSLTRGVNRKQPMLEEASPSSARNKVDDIPVKSTHSSTRRPSRSIQSHTEGTPSSRSKRGKETLQIESENDSDIAQNKNAKKFPKTGFIVNPETTPKKMRSSAKNVENKQQTISQAFNRNVTPSKNLLSSVKAPQSSNARKSLISNANEENSSSPQIGKRNLRNAKVKNVENILGVDESEIESTKMASLAEESKHEDSPSSTLRISRRTRNNNDASTDSDGTSKKGMESVTKKATRSGRYGPKTNKEMVDADSTTSSLLSSSQSPSISSTFKSPSNRTRSSTRTLSDE